MPSADEFLNSYQPPSADAFLDSYSAPIDKYQSKVNQIMDDQAAGKISRTGAALGIYGQGVSKEVGKIGEAANHLIPQFVNDGASFFANTYDPGANIRGGIANTVNAVNQYGEKNYPATTTEVQALGNIAKAPLAATGLVSAGNVALDAGKVGAAKIGKGVAIRAKGFGADGIDELAANIDHNYTQASNTINQAHEAGAVLTPEAGQSIVDQIKANLTANRFNPAKHVDTAADLASLEKQASQGNLTLGHIDDFRKSLGDTIKDNTSKLDGANADAFQAVQAKNALLDGVSNLPENAFIQGSPDVVANLRTGINQYAQAARYEKVANIAKNADGDSNAFARGIKNFVKNDNNLKGFSTEEIAALKDIPRKGIGGTVENWLGKFGIDANRAVAPVAMSLAKTGAAPFIPGGIPLVGAGTIARATSKLATKGKFQNALDTIAARDTAVTPVSSQITGMRNRINTANNLPPTIEDQLLLQGPQAEYLAGGPGGVLPRAAAQAEMQAANAQRQALSQMGLTPDVVRAQQVAQVGNAYEQNAALQEAFRQQQANALAQQYSEHVLLNNKPTNPMMAALQEAFLKKKAINGQK